MGTVRIMTKRHSFVDNQFTIGGAMTRIFTNLIVVLVCVSALPACGGGATPTPTPTGPTPTQITLTGVVRTSDSNSRVVGATIKILDGVNVGRVTTTNSNGQYRFDNLTTGNANVSATAEGYEESQAGVFIDGSNMLDFRLQSLPAVSVVGYVYDAVTHQAVSDVAVEVLGTQLRTATDINGHYRLTGILTTTFTVRYLKSGYDTLDKEYIASLGTEIRNSDVQLRPINTLPTTIGGIVFYDLDGHQFLLPNATVAIISPAADASRRTTTDSNGRYQLSGIQSARFTVRYSHPAFQTQDREISATLGSDRTNVDAKLTLVDPSQLPTITIGGRVSGDCSGRVCLIEGAEVIVLNADQSNSSRRTTTDSNGRYQLSGIQGAKFMVRYRHPNFRAVVVEYVFPPGTTQSGVDVSLGSR